jgi:hypothetical protein
MIERAGAHVCGMIFQGCELRALPSAPVFCRFAAAAHRCLDSVAELTAISATWQYGVPLNGDLACARRRG